ncbi:MAG: hypothetical protein N2712_03040 [Brevinematales bacterium]|nr:hypothetical protein [Brevinematales bacterium]
MPNNQLSKSRIKIINTLFLTVTSFYIISIISATLFVNHNNIYSFFLRNRQGVILLLLITLIPQVISRFFEYSRISKEPYIRRQSIVLSIILLISMFLFIFSTLFEPKNYNDVLLGYLIPLLLISVASFLTTVNIVKLFYIYPSILYLLTSIALIIIVAVILHLPISSATGEPIPLIDTFFVATSAISCTGLTTISVGKELSFFGQLVLMIAIQLGGLLIIFISTVGILFGLLSGDAIVKLKMASMFEMKNIIQTQKLILKFVLLTFISQIIVAFIIYPYFFEVEKDIGKSIFYSIFHVVSALNNAGFSTYDESLIRFNNYPYFLLSLSYLILLGNTGIIAVIEIFDYIISRTKRIINTLFNRKVVNTKSISVFTKIVIISHTTLISFGTLAFFVFEGDHFLRQVKYPFVDALFNSISFRTAGFASFDFTQAKDSTYLFFSILMFIGGGSISVAGGVKMNTIALFFIALIVVIKSYPYIYFMRREIDSHSLIKASAVVIGAIIILTICIFIFYELVREERFSKIIFELTSAFGTVGTSSGITNKNLSLPAKLVLIFLMFIGKIGLITFLSILARKQPTPLGNFPKEKVIVG